MPAAAFAVAKQRQESPFSHEGDLLKEYVGEEEAVKMVVKLGLQAAR